MDARSVWNIHSGVFHRLPDKPLFSRLAERILDMNKLVAKVLVYVGMAVTMPASFVTGVVLWLVLPERRRAGQSVFLGIARYLWSDVHTYSTLGFGALLLIHLALNWGLFIAMSRRTFTIGTKGARASPV